MNGLPFCHSLVPANHPWADWRPYDKNPELEGTAGAPLRSTGWLLKSFERGYFSLTLYMWGESALPAEVIFKLFHR